MTKEIRLEIRLQNPVEGTVYGLQKGKGPRSETIQATIGNGLDFVFTFRIEVKAASGLIPAISGPFVQGRAGERFVYIVIGTYAGQASAPFSGRLKVPLFEEDFQNLEPDSDAFTWSCTVPGRTKEGKPFFATVKPFEGWTKGKLPG